MIRIFGYAAGLGMLGFGSQAAAYSIVNGILIDGKYWEGYQSRFQYNQLVPKLIGCSIPEDDNLAFAVPNKYTDAAIACHIGATPALLSAPTQTGATVSLALNPWNPGHKGPVITFLANCQGPYKTIDPLALKFFKIEELSLLGQPDDQYR